MLCLGLALGIGLAAPVLHAQQDNQDTTAQTAKKDKKKAEKPKQGKANKTIGRLRTINGVKPNATAKYYMVLQSASWCGPCNQEMPKIVAEYGEMRKNGVELIFVSCDKTPEDAAAFMKKYGADFACVGFNTPAAAALPGFTPERRVPRMSIVDASGKVVQPPVFAAHVLPKWRELTHTHTAE